jgi:hypothetical protein
MPVKLSTTVNKISLICNSTNVALIQDFYEYLKNTGASEKHINNNLKAIMLTLMLLFLMFKEESRLSNF